MKKIEPKAEPNANRQLRADFEFAPDKHSFIDLLSKRAFALRMENQNFRRALDYSCAATEFSRQINYENGIAWGLLNIARTMIHLDSSPSLHEYVDEALEIFVAMGNRRGEANSLLIRGKLFERQGNYVLANQFLEQGLNASRWANDPQSEQLGYFFFANLCDALEDPESVIKYSNFALSIPGEYGVSVRCTIAIGKALLSMGELDKAKAKFEEVLKQAEVHDDLYSKSIGRIQLGRVLARLGENEESRENLRLGLELANSIGLFAESDVVWEEIVRSYLETDDFEEALKILENFRKSSQKIREDEQNIVTLLKIAEAHLVGSNLNDARSILEEIGEEIEKTESFQYRFEYHRLLSNLSEAEGDYKASLAHMRIFYRFKELANDFTSPRKMSVLESKIRIEEQAFRENRINNKNKEAAGLILGDRESVSPDTPYYG